MKSLFELRRSSKVVYKFKPDKDYFRKPPTKPKKDKRKICRVMPYIVISNIDQFLEISKVGGWGARDIEYEASRVRMILLSKK